MKNIFLSSTVIAALGLSLAALADDTTPRHGGNSGGGSIETSGNYSAMAFGVKQTPHSSSFGFYVRGHGATQAQADADALDRCNTISQGYGCRLVE